MDNQQKTLRELALFAGAGGGILGGKLLGWETVCAVENEPYPASVLVARQNEGFLPPFPIWDDVRTFDGRPWKGIVDVVSGGFPCQDISPARTNSAVNGERKGLKGKKSGLWIEFFRIVSEVQPEYVFIENSSSLRNMGLVTILQDLTSLGYNATWGVLGAGDVKAPHQRKRMWVVGANPNFAQREGGWLSGRGNQEHTNIRLGCWWKVEPNVDRVADGMAARLDRLKAIGNGQVPIVAAVAFSQLYTSLMENT